ncbi:MAG TPA: endo alpha-1,4 polygalactosaminidase, partial [Solirubrobacteraceae bacterium]|nr:endo alpha-1,4 polygalactosaminidase [Solirubrobacteraceae bacterium]
AIFQKNDRPTHLPGVSLFDGMIIEQCNHVSDPCAGSGGDAAPYLTAHKLVLNAEYTQDDETTTRFCPADASAGIIGALLDVNVGGGTYGPCAPVGALTPGAIGSGGASRSGPGQTSGPGESPAARRTVMILANTKAPTLRGVPDRGARLKVSTGSWSGSPTSYSYAWRRCRRTRCSPVRHATKQTYSVGAEDVAYRIVAVVTARNARGSARAASARSAVVVERRLVSRPSRRRRAV